MRINVYSQEITSEVRTFGRVADTGVIYSAVQLMLHSSERLHHTTEDDDRSAVTFWLPKSPARRTDFANALRDMADMVEAAPPEHGLDE